MERLEAAQAAEREHEYPWLPSVYAALDSGELRRDDDGYHGTDDKWGRVAQIFNAARARVLATRRDPKKAADNEPGN